MTSHLVWYPGHDLLLPDIVRAENCHLFDSAGTRYVDLESGVWCTSIGHGHPRILRVLAEQAGRIAHTGFCYSNEVVQDAARTILAPLGLAGGDCVFLCSGSEAVEFGVRAARLIAGRPKFLTMADSYFGAYGSAHDRRQDEWFGFDWGASSPDWDAIPFDEIGGFLFEPGSSSGLVRFPPQRTIDRIVGAVRERNGLVLVNEVTTGVGRTGAWFGHQHYGIAPDIVALGKGIGNGYPVAVTAFAPGVLDRLGGEPVPYAQSHQNDPLGAAVAREVVRVIEEEGLIERGHDMAALLMEGLQGIAQRTNRIREIRGRGLMVALDLNDDAPWPLTAAVHEKLVRRGYIVGRRPNVPVLRIDPSLTVGPDDIRGFLDALEAVLADR